MRSFKALGFIMLWILLSFLWVHFGQAQVKRCPDYGQVESWLKSYPTLKNWYHFYLDRQGCDMDINAFFKTLAGSEPLSIRLNQAEVSFEQFYVPISNVLDIDWESVDKETSQKIQSDLNIIDHSLNRAMGTMNRADQDYFRAVVLLNLPSEFVQKGFGKKETTVSRRLNRESGRSPPIHSKEIIAPPYERVYAPNN